jgi:ribosomal protein S18 acetylase RimI-like enzyme
MLNIRDYRDTDHDAVWALHNDALMTTGAHAGAGPWDDDLHQITEQYINRGGIFLVGLLDQTVVAMGALKRIDSTTGEIKRMRVAPDHQRRGYGAAILLALEQRAHESGIIRLMLDTTDIQFPAQRFYEKHGYRETGRQKVMRFTNIYYEKILER